MEIENICALVSGGASGLGEATTRALVERGARVAIADINVERASELAAELGDQTIAVTCDVTSEDDVAGAVSAAPDPRGHGHRGVGWGDR